VDLKTEEGAYRVLTGLDGVLFSGGADLSPLHYGEEPLRPAWEGDPVRDAYELRLVRAARQLGLPLLGICRGAQLLNVALGGSLYQDINTLIPNSLIHRCPTKYDSLEHSVTISPDSWLSSLYTDSALVVNTVHHQAVKELAPGLMPTAQAPDGVVESFQLIDDKNWIVGIQWHPEWLEGDDHRLDGRPIFVNFAQVCAQGLGYRHAAE
jgi:putative glutamine amidotransferase